MRVFKDYGTERLNWTELMESGALIYGTMIGKKQKANSAKVPFL